jgi:flagellar M-ring protein FliF
MDPSLVKVANQTKAFVLGLTARQKIVLGLAGVAALGSIWLFVHFMEKPDYKLLYSGLQPAEAQSLAQKLSSKNTPYQLSSDGTSISVASDQIDSVRIDFASRGLPQSGRQGFELFDKPNWAGSDFAEQVNYQRALEGELERTIETIREVEAARVHVVMPHESLFTDQERDAKASVVLKLHGRLPDEALDAIVHLVSSAVDGLKPENVTLMDTDGRIPWVGRNGHARESSAALQFEAALSQKVVDTLAPVVGPGHVKANVTAEFEDGTSDTLQETYDPNAVAVLTSQTSEERQGGDVSEQGIPGTSSNVPGASGQAAATANNKTNIPGAESADIQKSDSKTYAVSKTVRHTVLLSGGLKRLTAAILVDDVLEQTGKDRKSVITRRKRTPEEMKQIQDVAMAALGYSQTRGDYIVVENLSFQTNLEEPPTPPTLAERLLLILQKWAWMLRYLGLLALLLLIYATVLRPVKKQIQVSFAALPALQPAGATGDTVAKNLQGSAPGGELVESSFQQELAGTNSEVKRTVMLKRQLVEKVKKEPVASSRLVQSWIHQDGM